MMVARKPVRPGGRGSCEQETEYLIVVEIQSKSLPQASTSLGAAISATDMVGSSRRTEDGVERLRGNRHDPWAISKPEETWVAGGDCSDVELSGPPVSSQISMLRSFVEGKVESATRHRWDDGF